MDDNIRDVYLHDRDVLEYVLYKILHMDYDVLSEPDVCKRAREELLVNGE